MIWIITGASHAGKTFLAQRMLEKFKFPYLSIDHLKMGLIRSGYTDLTLEDDDSYLSTDWVKEENRRYIEGFQKAGERIVLTEEDFKRTIDGILEDKDNGA